MGYTEIIEHAAWNPTKPRNIIHFTHSETEERVTLAVVTLEGFEMGLT